MSAAHTQGPWAVTSHGVRDVGGYICLSTRVSRYDGQEERYARELAQREADMNLIAASPELLAAAECSLALEIDADEGRAILERHGFVWADRLTKPATGFVAGLCRAAIARATGAAA